MTLLHWLSHFVGLDNLSGPFYGFWSGFGSDLSEFAILGVVWQHVRKHNCAVKGCWRAGRYPVGDGIHGACRKHHPEDIPKHIDVHHLRSLHIRHHGIEKVAHRLKDQ